MEYGEIESISWNIITVDNRSRYVSTGDWIYFECDTDITCPGRVTIQLNWDFPLIFVHADEFNHIFWYISRNTNVSPGLFVHSPCIYFYPHWSCRTQYFWYFLHLQRLTGITRISSGILWSALNQWDYKDSISYFLLPESGKVDDLETPLSLYLLSNWNEKEICYFVSEIINILNIILTVKCFNDPFELRDIINLRSFPA